MTRKERMLAMGLTVTLVALNLAAFNYLIAGGSTRVDLTEDRLFSISPTTRRIVTSLTEPVTIYGYFSDRTHPKLAPLVPRIVDMLEEYEAISGGKVRVEIYDPGDDEAAAEEASDRFGVNSTPFRLASKYETGIVNAYFALVVRYADQYERYGFDDLIEIEALPDGDIDVRLRNLEYDLTKAIKKVVHGTMGIEELFDAVPSTVRMTAIISEATLPEIFADAPEAVRTAADELEEIGGDRFEFVSIDPDADPETWQSFNAAYGLRPMSLGFFDDRNFYLYGLLEVDGRIEQLLLAGEELSAADIREAVEASLRRYTPGSMKTVGVVAPSPPQLPPQVQMQMGMRQPPPEFDEVKRFLARDFDVETVDLAAAAGVPVNVDVLLVIKPTELTEQEVYNLDQYLMRGGRVVVCSGRYDVDFDYSGLTVSPLESGLDDWLAHHGIAIEQTMVLDDRNQPLPIPEIRNTVLGQVRTWTMAPYPYLVQVRDEGFVNREVAARLDGVGIYWGSPLRLDDEPAEGVERLPLLRSSAASWTDDDTGRVAYVDYVVPEEGVEPSLLGVALAGRFTSFFEGRGAPEPAGTDADTGENAPATVTLERSPDTRLVVIGNAEFLSDFVARSLSSTDGGFFAENLRFVENVVDWVSLDNDMLAIRSRSAGARRLESVEPAAQVRIEIVNYLVPLGLLAAAGVWIFWRRRNTQPFLEEVGS